MTQDNHLAECRVEYIRTSPSAIFPTRAHGDGDSGFDVCSDDEDFYLQPGHRRLVQTGWRINVQHAWEGQVRSRSGNALNRGLMVLNSPGTIDSSYTGGLGVILFNTGNMPIHITKGMKVAQIVFQRIESVESVEVTEFTVGKTARGERGYGSTGSHHA